MANPNTWEGIIYRFTPDFGDDTRYGVINIQTDEPDVTQEVYYPSGGGDPQPIDPDGPAPIMNSTDELARVLGVRTQEFQRTTCSRSVLSAHFVSGLATRSPTKEVIPQVQCGAGTKKCLNDPTACCTIRNLGPWVKCSTKACMGVAAGCSRTGPVFGDCWGFGCAGAMLFCLL